MATNWPAPPGTNLAKALDDRYNLLQELGTGSLGTVYLGQALKNPARLVAVKLLHTELLTEPESCQEFSHEALILERLNHPNIPRFVDFKQTPDMAYLVTEYIEGGSLEKMLCPDPDLPPVALPLEQVDKLFEQITAAVAYLHRERLVHRDLKPANILVDPAGKVFLADLSLTTFLNSQTPDILVKTPAWGTPLYAAPEVWEDHAGKASDIYALGVILFQMIAGQTPFQGSQDELKEMHFHSPIPRLKDVAPGLVYPAGLDTVIAAALAKDPADRMNTVPELYRRFKAALEPAPAATPNGPFNHPTNQPANSGANLHWPSQNASGPATQAYPKINNISPVKIWAVIIGALFVLIMALIAIGNSTKQVHNSLTSTPGPTITAASRISADGDLIIAKAHAGAVTSFNWLSVGSIGFYSGSSDGTVHIWTLSNNQAKLLQTVNETSGVTALALSEDTTVLATALSDNTIELTSRKVGYPLTLKGPTAKITALKWSPDNKLLAAASLDKTVRVWDALGKVQYTLAGNTGATTSLAWSPDSQTLVTGFDDATLKLWSRDGSLKKTLTTQEGPVTAVAWSADGKEIASGAEDGALELWSSDGQRITTLKGHSGRVTGLDWSANGQLLASASADTTVRLWTADGKAVTVLPGSGAALTCVAWSADSKLAAGDTAGAIHIWNMNPAWFTS